MNKDILLFLDIDGVLNNDKTMESFIDPTDNCEYVGIDSELLKNLSSIVIATDCNIILSSTWRLIESLLTHFKQRLKEIGLESKYKGCTENIGGFESRHYEINNFVERAGINRFLAIDDWDMSKEIENGKFLRTYEKDGLTEDLASQAIEMILAQK